MPILLSITFLPFDKEISQNIDFIKMICFIQIGKIIKWTFKNLMLNQRNLTFRIYELGNRKKYQEIGTKQLKL